MPKIVVVLPTYNERENLPVLVEKIFALNIPGLSAVGVDDNSPDGTAKVAEGLAKKYPIQVIKRPRKMGLGTAYIEAFREILKGTGNNDSLLPEFIIQMDTDLSHDPAMIPVFLNKIANCDLVLGSRYVVGGAIANWDYGRQLISKFGNIYAKKLLGLPYHDLTGGFKCWKREALASLDFSRLNSHGYNFQIETTYHTHIAGKKILEVPITFTERKVGSSKFNFIIMFEAFWKVLMLKLRK